MKRIKFKCAHCLKEFSDYLSREGKRKFCSRECRGIYEKGRSISIERRLKISLDRRGSKSHFWKGGITKYTKAIKNKIEYRLWRENVFKRDNWTCVICKIRGGYLEADHIKPFSLYPELRFVLDNGRTLCKNCHKKTDTYAGRLFKFYVVTPKTETSSK